MPIQLVEGQDASGEFVGPTGSATLPAGTTAGNTVILVVDVNMSGTITTPSGFTQDSPSTAAATNKLSVYRRSGVPASETSWPITVSTSSPVAWRVREYEGIDPDFPVDVKPASMQSSASASVLTAGPTPASTAYDGLLLCAHGANSPNTTPPTWSGHTGGLAETAYQSATGATTSAGLSVGTRPVQSLAAWSVQATCSITTGVNSTVIVYAAAGAKRLSTPENIWGFEWLTAAGLAVGNTGQRIFEATTGSPEIVNDATKARTGSGYLRLSSTAAAENVADVGRALTVGSTPRAAVQRRCVRFDGGLPSVDTELFHIEPDTGGGTTVCRFVAASSKLGVKIGTGTEVLSDATVVADRWIAVDVRLVTTTTAHTCDWQVTYDATPGAGSAPVVQAQASFTASAVPTAYTSRLGWTGSITPGVPVLYDDCVDSIVAGGYPLGDHRIRLLKVDPAATPTVGGTVGNFALITSNATGAALTTPTLGSARDAIDEVPPTIGASADGVCQTATAATDYLGFAMATYQAAPEGSIRAVKLLACGWAASGTAATLAIILVTSADTPPSSPTATDPGFDASTTDPAWICLMLRPTGGWTQAVLDSLAFRVGYSSDAAPDIGIHAIYAEVAVQVAQVAPLFGEAAAAPRVEAVTDPLSGGVLALKTWTPADKAVDVTYEVSGTPTSYTAPAGSSPHTQMIGESADATVVNRITAVYAPEPTPPS